MQYKDTRSMANAIRDEIDLYISKSKILAKYIIKGLHIFMYSRPFNGNCLFLRF